jgi:YidC/Oxa1 family membrane protein insertase
MKVMNPNYETYGVEVLDITLRDKVGISLDVDEIPNLHNVVQHMLTQKESFKEQISHIMDNYLFYPGRSGEAGGRYIVKQLESLI